MQETQVPSLGQEDPLEKGMATHSSILAWKTPWTEKPGRLQSMGCGVRHDWVTNTHFFSDRVLKSKDITLMTKVHLGKAMVFPADMYECERTIKKAERRRTDVFKLWCWRRLLKVPWTATRSNQSILKEINSRYSLGGLMLKLKLQYFGHLMWRANSLEKTPMLGKMEGKRRKAWQRMRWLDSIADSMHMNLRKFWEVVEDREGWHAAVHGVTKSRTCLSYWTTIATSARNH